MVLQADITHKANNIKQLTYFVIYVNHFSDNF